MDKVTGSDPVDGSSILPKRAIIKKKYFLLLILLFVNIHNFTFQVIHWIYTKQAMSTKNVDIFLSTFI